MKLRIRLVTIVLVVVSAAGPGFAEVVHDPKLTLRGHEDWVIGVAWNPAGPELASCGSDKTVKIWNPTTGESLRTLSGHRHIVYSVAWTADGTKLASGSYDNTVKIWDAASGNEVRTLTGHTRAVMSVDWTPDGTKLASGSQDHTLRVWDAASGDLLHRLTGHTDLVISLGWSPDGTKLASGGFDNTLKLWDAESGEEIRTLAGHTLPLEFVDWSPDGSKLATGGRDKTIKVWDAASGREELTLTGHTLRVESVVWSPDGTKLASGSQDKSVKIWSAATGEELFTLSGHTDSARGVAWSPDGSRLATSSQDRTIKIWSFPKSAAASKRPGFGLYAGVFKTERETIDHIEKCAKYGVSTLHPSLSGGGSVLWKTDKEYYYPDFRDLMQSGYDGLRVLIQHAHAAGLRVYPSVAVCLTGKILDQHPEWETRDREGQLSSATTSRAISLAYPRARAAKISLIMDLVTRYEIDGVMLDYCRYPETTKSEKTKYGFYGYDEPLIEACRSIHGFDPRQTPINSTRWNRFNQMRAHTVTAFVREFRAAVEASGRKIRIGGFGDTDPAYEARMCGRDCARWAREGLIEDYFLATYTESVDRMPDVVRRARQLAGHDVSLLTALSPFNNFLKTNDEMVAAAKAQIAGGADGLWIYRRDALERLNLWEGAAAASRLMAAAMSSE